MQWIYQSVPLQPDQFAERRRHVVPRKLWRVRYYERVALLETKRKDKNARHYEAAIIISERIFTRNNDGKPFLSPPPLFSNESSLSFSTTISR